MEELLSVFEDSEAAKRVLHELIDARLLTSFEVTATEEDEKSRHRVEIIHESLLSAWPRLVRWRTQDQDIRSWNLDEGTYERLLEESVSTFDLSQDGRILVGVFQGKATVDDLEGGSRRPLSSHGDSINKAALDPTGRLVVTGDEEGVIRVGPITGEEPHLLLGHEGDVLWVKVSPKGDCIASGGADHTVRLWPMPHMDRRPFHTLPLEEVLASLKRLTNLRAVADKESSTGYRIDIGPFPGWEKVPVW
jgi:WD40 repeat protein